MTPTAKDYREAATYFKEWASFLSVVPSNQGKVNKYRIAARACRELARRLSKKKGKK